MYINFIPKYAFFIAGTGAHLDRLQAFDRALIDAGPLAHNLVAVSSIIPAGCEIIAPEKGFKMLTPGQIIFCVMARQETNQKGENASASVGIALSKDFKSFGYISEYHGNATTKQEAENIAKKLAKEMFAIKLNTSIEMLDLKVLDATAVSINQAGSNEWVCAVALCVFVL